MLKKLKKGFTLVELVVVLVLMGLITTAIAMVLRPTTNLYIDVNNKTNEEIAAITLFDVINGELRYATDVYVTSATDDSTLPASTLPHFIMLSNCKRDGEHFNAHGYAKHGFTSHGLIGAGYVGNSNHLLEKTDIKFSIDGYSAADGKESLTIGAVMHPMSSKGMMKNKEYKYSETFKFLNLQNKAQLTQLDRTKMHLSMAGYDAAEVEKGINKLFETDNNSTEGEQAIFIFYQRPEEAAATLSATPPSGSNEFKEFKAVRGNKTIDLGPVSVTYNLVMQKGTGNIGDPKIELPSSITAPDSAGHPKSGDFQVQNNVPLTLTIQPGTSDTIKFKDGSTVLATLDINDFTTNGTDTLYIQNDGSGNWSVEKTPYVDTSDDKTVKLHYVRVNGDGYGNLFITYADNTVGHKVTINNGELVEGTQTACTVNSIGEGVYNIHFAERDTVLNVDVGADVGGPIDSLLDMTLNNDSLSDVYVFMDSSSGFRVVYNYDDLPDSVKNTVPEPPHISYGEYGGADPTSDGSAQIIALDVSASNLTNYMYVESYNASSIEVYDANRGVPLSINNRHIDISSCSGDTRFIFKMTVPYDVELKVAFWNNEWQNDNNYKLTTTVHHSDDSYGADVYTY